MRKKRMEEQRTKTRRRGRKEGMRRRGREGKGYLKESEGQ